MRFADIPPNARFRFVRTPKPVVYVKVGDSRFRNIDSRPFPLSRAVSIVACDNAEVEVVRCDD